MSYRTEFTLEIQEGGPTPEQVAQKLSERAAIEMVGGNRRESQEYWLATISARCDCSWWDHEKHIEMVSACWPKTLFTLRGVGEDPGDQWVLVLPQPEDSEGKPPGVVAAPLRPQQAQVN